MKKAEIKGYSMRLNVVKDADVIKRLEEVRKIQTYIKYLIREDIKKSTPDLTTKRGSETA